MASIEYGIDGYGRKVYPRQAVRGRTYTCPCCLEEIIVRYRNGNYFAHKPIKNRTPLQRICPGYKGVVNYKKIEGKVDKVYIINGGLPLYLGIFRDEKYQLNAYFPPLSQSNMNSLEEWGTKVIVTEGGAKKEYSASNIRFYRLKTTVDWIKVKCKVLKHPITEVQQKWEWGVRGLDCEKDIFHSHYAGGFRVALHSNIVVGKEYLIVIRNNFISSIKGVCFERKGCLSLNNWYDKQEFSIYAMTVNSITDEAISYVQNKGYQLIGKSDEIIPMWPPALIEGKELIYRRHSNEAFLFHGKWADQRIFNVSEYGITNIEKNENIFETRTNNKTLLLSDHKFNIFSNEIRYMLTQTRNNFDNDKLYKPNIMWRTDESTLKLLTVAENEILKAKKIFFDTDTKITICILKKNYVEMSSKRIVANLKRNRVLVVDMGAFGKIWLESKPIMNKEKEIRKIYINDIVEYLYCCNAISVPIPNEILQVFEYARQNSGKLYRVMLPWIQKQKIPFAAAKYLYSIKEVLKDE
ncbi:hypothetical protein SH1V18_38420 [Vallitalea longa]|uniref:Uncharacterized protein n=1 Tax=Vallitalea longa TaxID=2936439 RepID=A0A9W5YD97_9FIRM|nr:hypothetical protein [Vallitalea longa]GKX31362.1 hypothetical protein SH1V18_38420 [Vallitalea longa]